MQTCPQRTVQSIDKNKMKNAGVRKCVCHPVICPPPTAGNIVNHLKTHTVTFTNGTSFQWWYLVGSTPVKFVDGNGVSGSTTSVLTINQQMEGNLFTIYCIVSNVCGSATSNTTFVLFTPPS